jgi:hypothetical protein
LAEQLAQEVRIAGPIYVFDVGGYGNRDRRGHMEKDGADGGPACDERLEAVLKWMLPALAKNPEFICIAVVREKPEKSALRKPGTAGVSPATELKSAATSHVPITEIKSLLQVKYIS